VYGAARPSILPSSSCRTTTARSSPGAVCRTCDHGGRGEPGYYPGTREGPDLVTNAGILRHEYGVGEGWRPVSVEFGGATYGERMTTPMAFGQVATGHRRCAMYGVSLEPYFEGCFFATSTSALLRRCGGWKHRPLQRLPRASGDYYAHLSRRSRSLSSRYTDAVIPFLTDSPPRTSNYDVKFNYQHPTHEFLERYKVVVLPTPTRSQGMDRGA